MMSLALLTWKLCKKMIFWIWPRPGRALKKNYLDRAEFHFFEKLTDHTNKPTLIRTIIDLDWACHIFFRASFWLFWRQTARFWFSRVKFSYFLGLNLMFRPFFDLVLLHKIQKKSYHPKVCHFFSLKHLQLMSGTFYLMNYMVRKFLRL